MSEFISPMRSSQVRQLIELVIHEVRLIYRQRAVVALVLLIGIFMAVLTVTDNPVIFPPPQYRSPISMFTNSMNMLYGILLMVVVLPLPLLLADMLPTENRTGVAELRKTYLPGTAVFLTGKMLGAAIAVLMVLLIVIAVEASLLFLALGTIHAQFFVEVALWSILPAAVYVTCLSILLSAPFRSRAGGLVAGLAIIGWTVFTVRQSGADGSAGWGANLSPVNDLAFRNLLVKWGEPFGVQSRFWGVVSPEQIILPLLIGAVEILAVFVVTNYLLSRKGVRS